MNVRDCFVYEEGGYFWLTDHYDLNRVRFKTKEERDKWIESFPLVVGKELVVHIGKPNVITELTKEMFS